MRRGLSSASAMLAMRVLLLPVLLLPVLLAPVLLAPDLGAQPTKPRRTGNGQDHVQKQIDGWIRKLHLTGPEAKLGREDAVVNLISMNDPRAHEPLNHALDRAADGKPDSKPEHVEVARLILTELRRSLANHQHPVFGVGAARDSMRRTYVLALVQFYIPLVNGNNNSNNDSNSNKAHVLQDAAGVCLRQMKNAERVAGAQMLLETKNAKLQKATLLALGDCWDLGLAPFLNYQLGNGWFVGNGDMTVRYDWDSKEWYVPIGVRFGRVIVNPNSSFNIYAEYQTSLIYDNYPGAAVENSFRINFTLTMPAL